MKSPITGKQMSLRQERVEHEFRKETFTILYHYYLCEDTGQKFEDEHLAQLNLDQVYHQFRNRHNLPFPEDIIALRRQYDISAARMSEVLGFGINVYKSYEAGEIPNSSNARLIQLAHNPREFRKLVELSNALNAKERTKVMHKIDELVLQEDFENFTLSGYLMGDERADEQTGYRRPSLDKFVEMVIFFTREVQPNLWKTKLNKMLFYADFLHFKKSVQSISGCRYRAIDMGPVPNNFHSLFDYMVRNEYIDSTITTFANGSIGEQFTPHTQRSFDASRLTETELETLQEVVSRFKTIKTSDIVTISHQEQAWEKNFKNGKKLISYLDAFTLIHV